jgi:hypothetical protein
MSLIDEQLKPEPWWPLKWTKDDRDMEFPKADFKIHGRNVRVRKYPTQYLIHPSRAESFLVAEDLLDLRCALFTLAYPSE